MRLLDRYLLRELLVPLTACLGGFLMFWITFDLFSEMDEFQKHQLTIPDVAELYLVRLPEFLVLVMPMALLLALLYALTNHARHEELTAIRSAGVGIWRLCVPYLAVGLLFSLNNGFPTPPTAGARSFPGVNPAAPRRGWYFGISISPMNVTIAVGISACICPPKIE